MIDLLYLCHGRIEFTQVTLTTLIANTNWSLVDNFVVYNDAATDGHKTTGMLVNDFGITPRLTNLGSPVGVMNHFLWRSEAEMFAKIDNDIMVPPGWLEEMLEVMERDPQLDLLGMEAGMSLRRATPDPVECYTFSPCRNIGGVGVMRRRPFNVESWPRPNGRFGFTEWQHRHRNVMKGWIEPDLRVFSLDKLPFEPWRSQTKLYRQDEKLQRDWGVHPRDMQWYWSWANIEMGEEAA